MRESELANLLVQMGLDRGMTIEQVAAELAALGMPSFVDAGAFRSHVLQAAETQMRSQVEAQINRLRQQAGLATSGMVGTGSATFAATTPPAPAPAAPVIVTSNQPDPRTAAPAAPVTPLDDSGPADSPVPDLAAVVASLGGDEQPAREPEIELPSDATVVWTNFDANRNRSGS